MVYLYFIFLLETLILFIHVGFDLDRGLLIVPYVTCLSTMSETFNRVIIDSRSKPIITMPEETRLYLMKRWAINRMKVTTFQGYIYLKIQNKL